MAAEASSEMTVKAALMRSVDLEQASDTGRLDTEILLAFVLGKQRTWLYTWPDEPLSRVQQQQFEACLQRRRHGEPVAYITGRRAFWTFDLQVNPQVLIPRPETELLVELALSYLADEKPTADLNSDLDVEGCADSVADLGTGSGAIALALASERPHVRVVAIDRSEGALEVARANALEYGLNNIDFRAGSWCAALPARKFTMIVSNPPYIDRADPHLMQGDLRFEPASALIAADQGLADIETICQQASQFLKQGGILMLEHGYNQADAVRALLQRYHYGEIKSCQDLAGHERVTLASFRSGNTDSEREKLHAR
jgi:release factor glutamine methyltransferase